MKACFVRYLPRRRNIVDEEAGGFLMRRIADGEAGGLSPFQMHLRYLRSRQTIVDEEAGGLNGSIMFIECLQSARAMLRV